MTSHTSGQCSTCGRETDLKYIGRCVTCYYVESNLEKYVSTAKGMDYVIALLRSKGVPIKRRQ